MNIDLMRREPTPHYVVSPSNEYEEQLLTALYKFHQARPILLDEKTHELGVREPHLKGTPLHESG